MITSGDVIDFYFILTHKGFNAVRSRIKLTSKSRTISHCGTLSAVFSNWWNIPAIGKNWNRIISGIQNIAYPEYVCREYFGNRADLTMLSPGCGTGVKELPFSRTGKFKKITGFDLSEKRINVAGVERGISRSGFQSHGYIQN